MNPAGLALLVVIVGGFCVLIMIIVQTVKKDIKESREIEKKRWEKFESKGDPVARKYGMTILIMMGAAPFVWAFLGFLIEGKLLINSHPIAFMIIYLAIGIGLVKVYDAIKNK